MFTATTSAMHSSRLKQAKKVQTEMQRLGLTRAHVTRRPDGSVTVRPFTSEERRTQDNRDKAIIRRNEGRRRPGESLRALAQRMRAVAAAMRSLSCE